MIIWLHGQGEGGRDVDIALLGNEVCALARDEIQSYFTAGSETGSYVLAVQCETYWMDEGDGQNGRGYGASRYTRILMDTIADYVRSNPDIDTNRIYLGGCSNGGYMTVHMLTTYPDYFAAGYPVCEAYAFDRDFGKDAQILKDIPLWFTLSADDAVVDPKAIPSPPTVPSSRPEPKTPGFLSSGPSTVLTAPVPATTAIFPGFMCSTTRSPAYRTGNALPPPRTAKPLGPFPPIPAAVPLPPESTIISLHG